MSTKYYTELEFKGVAESKKREARVVHCGVKGLVGKVLTRLDRPTLQGLSMLKWPSFG